MNIFKYKYLTKSHTLNKNPFDHKLNPKLKKSNKGVLNNFENRFKNIYKIKLRSKLLKFINYNNKIIVKRNTQMTNLLLKLKKNYQVSGYRFLIAGRLKGVQRARNLNFKKGAVKFNKLTSVVQAKLNPIQTKWGKFGIKT